MKAHSTAEYVAQLSKEKRKDRQIIFIDNLVIRYVPDFNPPETGGLTAPPPGGVTASPEAKPPKPGFEVTIVGRSPYKDLYKLLADNFISNLRDLGNRPDLPFTMVKEDHPIQWVKSLKEQTENLEADIPGITGGGGTAGGAAGALAGGGPPAGAGLVEKEKDLFDPLLGIIRKK